MKRGSVMKTGSKSAEKLHRALQKLPRFTLRCGDVFINKMMTEKLKSWLKLRYERCASELNQSLILLFRPLFRGEVFYTQMGFLCSDNFGRSIRSLWVVSIESPSSVEYGIEKSFSVFVFNRELLRLKVLWTLDAIIRAAAELAALHKIAIDHR